MLLTFDKSLESSILLIRIPQDLLKALFRYLSLEKFKSIGPLTSTLFIVNTFSLLKIFVDEINRNIVAVKKIKIYSFLKALKYFINK